MAKGSHIMFTCPHCGAKSNDPQLGRNGRKKIYAECRWCGQIIEYIDVFTAKTVLEGRKNGK